MRCFATRASLTACLQPASFLLSGVPIAFSERRFRIARPSTLFRSSLRACDSVPSGASAFFFSFSPLIIWPCTELSCCSVLSMAAVQNLTGRCVSRTAYA